MDGRNSFLGDAAKMVGDALGAVGSAARGLVTRTLGIRDVSPPKFLSRVGDTAYFNVTQPFDFDVAQQLTDPQLAGVRSVFLQIDNGAEPAGTIRGLSNITSSSGIKLGMSFRSADTIANATGIGVQNIDIGSAVAYQSDVDPTTSYINQGGVGFELLSRSTGADTQQFAIAMQGEATRFNPDGSFNTDNAINIIGLSNAEQLAETLGIRQNTLAINGQVPASVPFTPPYMANADAKIYPTKDGGFKVFSLISSASQGLPGLPSPFGGTAAFASYPTICALEFNARGMLKGAEQIVSAQNTGITAPAGTVGLSPIPYNGKELAAGETFTLDFRTDALPNGQIAVTYAYSRYTTAGNAVTGETAGNVRILGVFDEYGDEESIGTTQGVAFSGLSATNFNTRELRKIASEGISPDGQLFVASFGRGNRVAANALTFNATHPDGAATIVPAGQFSSLTNPLSQTVDPQQAVVVQIGANNVLTINPFYDPQNVVGDTKAHLITEGEQFVAEDTGSVQQIIIPSNVRSSVIVFSSAGQYRLVNNGGQSSLVFPYAPPGHNFQLTETNEGGVVSTTATFPGGVQVTFYNEGVEFVQDNVIDNLATTTLATPPPTQSTSRPTNASTQGSTQGSTAPDTTSTPLGLTSTASAAPETSEGASSSLASTSLASTSLASSSQPATQSQSALSSAATASSQLVSSVAPTTVSSQADTSSQPAPISNATDTTPATFNVTTLANYTSSQATSAPFTTYPGITSGYGPNATNSSNPTLPPQDGGSNSSSSGWNNVPGIPGVVGGVAGVALLGLVIRRLWQVHQRNRVASMPTRGGAGDVAMESGDNPAFAGHMMMETELGEGSGEALLPGHNVDMEEELRDNPAFAGEGDALMMSAPFPGPTIVHPSRGSRKDRQKSAGSTASAGGVKLDLSDDDLLEGPTSEKRREAWGTPRESKRRAASDPTANGSEREDSSDEDDRFASSYPGALGVTRSAPSAAPTHSTAWAQASAAAQGRGRGGSTATRGGLQRPTEAALHNQPPRREDSDIQGREGRGRFPSRDLNPGAPKGGSKS